MAVRTFHTGVDRITGLRYSRLVLDGCGTCAGVVWCEVARNYGGWRVFVDWDGGGSSQTFTTRRECFVWLRRQVGS